MNWWWQWLIKMLLPLRVIFVEFFLQQGKVTRQWFATVSIDWFMIDTYDDDDNNTEQSVILYDHDEDCRFFVVDSCSFWIVGGCASCICCDHYACPSWMRWFHHQCRVIQWFVVVTTSYSLWWWNFYDGNYDEFEYMYFLLTTD